MDHYFIHKEHKEEDYFEFSWNFFGTDFSFNSSSDVFSKNCVDYGTYVLLKTIKNQVVLSGNVLDIGCGYGPIGIVLATLFENSKFTLSDVNQTAVDLSIQNIKKNNIKNVAEVVHSFAYENISDKFDFIVSNPPIKAGKDVLMNILLGAYERLNDGGSLIFVIKKKFGEDSVKKALQNKFQKVEILERDSGYYVLSATKQ